MFYEEFNIYCLMACTNRNNKTLLEGLQALTNAFKKRLLRQSA